MIDIERAFRAAICIMTDALDARLARRRLAPALALRQTIERLDGIERLDARWRIPCCEAARWIERRWCSAWWRP